ncbi:mamu class II histocompatibility antigen, DR alpha chain-like [Centropristis striata]|uniref:mamu class II histocompatibility antigen, DR alpha chain-like n=1 Tax=Centropristis striata TaxID=184440 RepID=UPI0027E143BD|nr:mamu class II histocompatibility antigen, DR alpha chain-like [Centropristis striata]
MMMKMVIFILSGVLCVSADFLHEDLAITGCSEKDGEGMIGLDGEEIWYADFKNKKGVEPQPSFIDRMSFPGGYEAAVAGQQICKQNLAVTLKALKNPPVKLYAPSSPVVYSRDDVELGEENTLICYVTGFYPAPVDFSWTKNGQNVTEGTSVNVPYPNKDASYNQFSSLVFTPKLGDIYSCSVTHLALDQPQTRFWNVEKTPPSIGPTVFCGLGLTVGLLGVVAGTFFLIKGS